MLKRSFIYLSLIVLILGNIDSKAFASVISKVCSAQAKACTSNIRDLENEDEEVLQACKDCCDLSIVNAPDSVKKKIKVCVPRCKKSCEKVYKKAVAGN